MEENTCDLGQAKRAFSRIGLSLTAILILGTIMQIFWVLGLPMLLGEDHWLISSSWGMWLGNFLPLYLVAIPTGIAIMRRLPAQTPPEHRLGFGNGVTFFLISMFVMYTGNLIGTILSALLSGGTAQNAVAELAMDNNPLKVLFVVILAPMLEEFVFRRQIIDRTRCYGEKTAALLSGLTFGLLHQNLFQFFYAFGLGLIMAYIYLRTGRLRYTVLLHSVINFMGSVLAPWILSLCDLEVIASMDPNAPAEELLALYSEILPGLLALGAYALLLIALSIAGLVLFIIRCRKLVWKDAALQLPKGTAGKTVYWNVGMVVYMLLCLTTIVLSLM